ncbi:MAG: PHP domain-containing protein [Acidobacteriia bacterium]|nr:PHP domain-containing protein [Terriglobia bacterium]
MSDRHRAQERWLKAELHAHCSLDPMDYRLSSYSAEELITESARLGYQVLAITCHNLDVWTPDLSEYAAGLGITLIPGMEVTTDAARHILVYNFGTSAENLKTLRQIRALCRPDTLVVAPHPYFPSRKCLGGRLEHNIEVFDAIEISGFRAPGLDFNRRARRLAAAHSKPLVGNGDVHQLWQLGHTFTWIYTEPGIRSILSAVKQGRVRVESTSLSYARVAWFWAKVLGCVIFPSRTERDERDRQFLPAPAPKGSESESSG